MKKKGRIGSSFDDFLNDTGIYEEVPRAPSSASLRGRSVCS